MTIIDVLLSFGLMMVAYYLVGFLKRRHLDKRDLVTYAKEEEVPNILKKGI